MTTLPGDILLYYCVGAQDLFIAAPYIKVDALSRVLDEASNISSLTCVTRWTPQDLAVGASDTECRTLVKGRGGTFMLHPSLHAKYYRVNDVVLIGSANLTASALGWSIQPNLEILCHAGYDFDAPAFQQELLQNAREISDEEFSQWEAVEKVRIEGVNVPDGGRPFLDTWWPSTRDPRHLEFAYRNQHDEIASFDEQNAASRDIQAMQVPQGLESQEFRLWVSTCLLAAPLTATVMWLESSDAEDPPKLVSEKLGISVTVARRRIETVHNWLIYFDHKNPIDG